MSDPVLYECFRLRLAWDELVGHLTRESDPNQADPHDLFGSARAAEHDRLVALLYGHHIGETLEDAERILEDTLALACAGRRPRTLSDLGFTLADFGVGA